MENIKHSNGIMRRKAVTDLIQVSRSTLYVWVRNKEFPAPTKLGARSVGWFRQDVLDWLASKDATSCNNDIATNANIDQLEIGK